jgi:hypothetical protein
MKKDWRIYIAPTLILIPFIPFLVGMYSFYVAALIAGTTGFAAFLYLAYMLEK